MFIRRGGRNTQLLCVSCSLEFRSRRSDLIFYELPKIDLDIIEELNNELNKNLRQAYVHQMVTIASGSCSPLRITLSKGALSCMHLALQNKLNFTAEFENRTDDFVFTRDSASSIISGMIADKYLKDLVVNYEEQFIYEWVISGEFYVPFTFVWVLRPVLSQSALWRKMDLSTWLSAVVSALCAIFVLKLVRGRKLPRISSAQIILATLLEQGQIPKRGTLKLLGFKAVVVLAIWITTAIVITNGYKGLLFSSLTGTTLPHLPSNMEELIRSKVFLLSTSHYFSQYNFSKESLIHLSIEQILEEGHPTKQMRKSLRQLYKNVVFTNSSISEIAFTRSSKAKGYKIQSPSKRFELSPDHILIGTKREISLYSLLVKLTKRKVGLLKGSSMHLFLQRSPLLILRNCFTPQFTGTIMQIVQSGLWTLWLKYEDARSKLQEIRTYLILKARRNHTLFRNWYENNGEVLDRRGLRAKYNTMGLVWGSVQEKSNAELIAKKFRSLRVPKYGFLA
ncbi:unnamed protein product [Allacma fusca]|uniref:Uncharacterized protein n=1 Tax=Allacma fusca TaxID=39272 RepID=A0A8J2K0N1_9HEXA|nr:unnamed protein product [Allacma fusca]